MKKILFAILSIFCLVGCTSGTYTESVEITFDEFQTKIENNESFVLFMWQTGCSHCENFEPTVNEVIKKYDILIYSINLKELTDEQYAKIENKTFVSGTPTMVVFKEGKLQSKKLVGEKSSTELIEYLKKYEIIK